MTTLGSSTRTTKRRKATSEDAGAPEAMSADLLVDEITIHALTTNYTWEYW